MKYFFSIISLLFLTFNGLFGQEKAVTENNDTVYLYPNGTWTYELNESLPVVSNELSYLNNELVLDTIEQAQRYSEAASNGLKNRFGLFEVKYDPAKWKRVPPAQFNEEAEFSLMHKEKEIYCVIISEEIEVGFENMPKIAMNTMEANTGGIVDLKKTELRKVNGVNVIRGVFDIRLSGMKFTFDSYYYSSEKGSIQFSTWTGQNLWDKYEEEIIELLNGIIIKE